MLHVDVDRLWNPRNRDYYFSSNAEWTNIVASMGLVRPANNMYLNAHHFPFCSNLTKSCIKSRSLRWVYIEIHQNPFFCFRLNDQLNESNPIKLPSPSSTSNAGADWPIFLPLLRQRSFNIENLDRFVGGWDEPTDIYYYYYNHHHHLNNGHHARNSKCPWVSPMHRVAAHSLFTMVSHQSNHKPYPIGLRACTRLKISNVFKFKRRPDLFRIDEPNLHNKLNSRGPENLNRNANAIVQAQPSS